MTLALEVPPDELELWVADGVGVLTVPLELFEPEAEFALEEELELLELELPVELLLPVEAGAVGVLTEPLSGVLVPVPVEVELVEPVEVLVSVEGAAKVPFETAVADWPMYQEAPSTPRVITPMVDLVEFLTRQTPLRESSDLRPRFVSKF